MKADKKADDKAQKASTAPAQQQAVAQPNAENDDQELDPNVSPPRPCRCGRRKLNLVPLGILQDARAAHPTDETGWRNRFPA